MARKFGEKRRLWCALFALAAITLPASMRAQDDPPTRAARLGYVEGSVSFQPAGMDDWISAVPNRPMTTGDQLWSDMGSRAELQLGSAAIRLSENTGISFLNLDDHTVQLQLSAGTINIRVRRLHGDDDFEIDTPNLAFTITDPGSYRVQASEDGSYTVISVRAGDGEVIGGGQAYSLEGGQVGYFDGTNTLDADVEPIDEPDQFDLWVEGRDHRYDDSRSAQYLSPDVVGYEDLDDYGYWQDDPNYGHIWFPNRVEYGWAPYHTGHWAWIDPWGYTWVDDSPWGYAPFHYGRWVFIAGRWGWVAGPPAQPPVYAPALVVFVGGGGGWGGNVGWFPLGPREVYVPTYPVSQAYMTQVNVSSTTLNVTQVTTVYNATIVNKTTTVTNVTYVNRTVPGAVVAMPQNSFAGGQPVAKAAVRVSPQQIAAAPVSAHVAVNPTRDSVLGGRAATAGHVSAPPAAVRSRQVVAKKTPPPPPVPFEKQQAAMAAHPGQPLPKTQLASLRPAAAARPAVKVAPPAPKPVKPPSGHPNPAAVAAKHAQPAQPAARPGQPAPAERPTQPAPAERPAAPAPAAKPPENRRGNPPAPAPRPAAPAPARPPAAQPKPPAQPNRPPAAQSKPAAPPPHPPAAAPQQHPPAAKPAAPPPKQPAKPQSPEEKKKQEQQKPPGE
jgi:hypothetical protein